LDADYYATVERTPTPGVPTPAVTSVGAHDGGVSAHPVDAATRTAGRHAAERPGESRTSGDAAWLRLLERAFGGWAPTLRGSLALVALFLCAAVLLVLALGVAGAALSAGLAVLAYWLNAAGHLPRA
jgi:hypothetical protein